jgi:hypothetical protein
MPFASIDALVNAITNDQANKMFFQKSSNNAAASAAGRWHDCLQWAGVPSAMNLGGTAGTAVQLNSATAGALPIGANVAPLTRHLTNLMALTPTATAVPATVLLCDFLLLYPSLVVTGTPTTLTNGVGLPRYTDGVGVQAVVTVNSALGATQPALTFTYTDQGGTGGNVAAAHTAPAASAPLSTCFLTDGSPFVRLAAGDSGIRSVQSYTLATGTTGTASLLLCKPLATIPVLAVNTASERDLVYQLPSLPKVEDGACLGFLVQVGGALVTGGILMGTVDTAHG